MDWFESEEFWQNLKPRLNKIEQIYLTGGEPMLSQTHLRLLEYLVAEHLAEKIVIKYNTNLTVLPQKILNLWHHFKQVRINGSVDGVSEVNDYIRYPSLWSEVNENLQKLDREAGAHANLDVTVHFTLQALNALDLCRTLDYLKSFKGIRRLPFINVLNHPTYLNVRVLPISVKAQVKADLITWLSENPQSDFEGLEDLWTRIRDLSGYIDGDDLSSLHLDELMSKTKALDLRRGQDLALAVPRLAELL